VSPQIEHTWICDGGQDIQVAGIVGAARAYRFDVVGKDALPDVFHRMRVYDLAAPHLRS
jgi:hypothetical protein